MDETLMDAETVLVQLKAAANPNAVADATRFGIRTPNNYGIATPKLREIAKPLRKNHDLAAELWASGIFDARVVAALIDDPKYVTEGQMEAWASEFDNWAIVDGCCIHLFCRTPYAYAKAVEWSARDAEYVKRAGFTLMAGLAVHDKKADDNKFKAFLPIIQRESTDGRTYVKKAVNWALRQIGKRNLALNAAAIETAQAIRQIDSSVARWIAADALRELQSEKVQARLRAKG
jgi:3-methyladenine DNA glycosylase AlkD